MRKQVGSFSLGALEHFATSFRADFRFGPINVMALLAICLSALGVHLAVYPFELEVVTTMVAVALTLAGLLRISQIWEAALLLTTGAGTLMFLLHRPESEILVIGVVLAGLLAPCIQMAYQWEKAVVLRFGRFRGLRGSGLFGVMPVIDKVSNYVDQRIRVTDFSAETTLTRDTVPVNVDAIAFWMVWDAEKAVLEVEDFGDANVTGSARRSSRSSTPRPAPGASRSSRSRSGTSSFQRASRTP